MTVRGRKLPVLLVVEDDHDMRSLLRDELWNEGFHLEEATNGDEALAVVMKDVPDLIITDLHMPAGGNDVYQPPPDIRAGLSDRASDGLRGQQDEGRSAEVGSHRLFQQAGAHQRAQSKDQAIDEFSSRVTGSCLNDKRVNPLEPE